MNTALTAVLTRLKVVFQVLEEFHCCLIYFVQYAQILQIFT